MKAAAESCRAYGHETWSGVRRCYSADILRFLNKGDEPIPDDFKHRLSALATPEMSALFFYRLAHYLYVNGWRRLARWVSATNLFIHKIWIPPQSCVGPGLHIPHPPGVTFAGRAGAGLTIYSLAICGPWEPSPDPPLESCPVLGDHVTLGAHAALMGSFTVAANVKIAYSLRVTSDIPQNSLVVSNALRMKIRPAVFSVETT